MKDKNQNAFGATTCSVCGMLYSPSTTEDETQHLLFHNQFISAVRYVVRFLAYLTGYDNSSVDFFCFYFFNFWLKYFTQFSEVECKTLMYYLYNICCVFGHTDINAAYFESFTGLEKGEDFRGIPRWQDYTCSPRRP